MAHQCRFQVDLAKKLFSTILIESCDCERKKTLVKLTHVCHSWRVALVSNPSFWTRIDFPNIDKISTYIERSKSSPLSVIIRSENPFPSEITKHVNRIECLAIIDCENQLLGKFEIGCNMPALKMLEINVCYKKSKESIVLDSNLFRGGLPSLQELRLCGVTGDLPWKNLDKLQVFRLRDKGFTATQIHDLFKSAPHLHTIEICSELFRDLAGFLPKPLRKLKVFDIDGEIHHPIIPSDLDNIPKGVSLTSRFDYSGEESPLLKYLPGREGPPDMKYLSHITSINLKLDSQTYTQLSGPSGSLRVLANWEGRELSEGIKAGHIFRSLSDSILSTTERLTISNMYNPPVEQNSNKCPIRQTLLATKNLRTLTLIACNNLPFIQALDPGEEVSSEQGSGPGQNGPKSVLCDKMEELALYYFGLPAPYSVLPAQKLAIASMLKNRASRGAKLPLLTIVSCLEKPLVSSFKPSEELKEHVTRMECRVNFAIPDWDDIIPLEHTVYEPFRRIYPHAERIRHLLRLWGCS